MALYRTTLGQQLPDVLTVEPFSTVQENANKQILEDAILDLRALLKQTQDALASAAVPSGAMQAFGGLVAPVGYLLCRGQSVLRTVYPELFKAIGVLHGAADVTHFNLPDYRGRVVVGLDTAQAEFSTMGKDSGSKTVTLTTAQIPAHSHQTGISGSVSGAYVAGNSSAAVSHNQALGVHTAPSGGGQAHSNLQPGSAANWIIKT
jgi:microcystin-dependent protein